MDAVPFQRSFDTISPRAVAAIAALVLLGALIAAPHVGPPRPDPFDDLPPVLSAPPPVAHNPDPAVIGPRLDP
jgi:hypothetical protein